MKKIAIICFTNFANEPRVLRTINALEKNYEITVFSDGSSYKSYTSHNVSKFNHDYEFSSSKNLFTRLFNKINDFFSGRKFQNDKYFEKKYWNGGRKIIYNYIKNQNFELLIGHGIYTLPILSKFSSTTKTIFNAHEFYLKEFEENEVWVKYSQPYYNYILNKYYKHIHITFCVSKIISDEYAKIFDVKSIEINNATGYQNLSPIENKEIVKIIHHGAAIRTRQIEIMINAINLLPKNYQLYLMLVKTDRVYYDELLKHKSEKIFFIEPVAVEEIAKKINNYDIGLFILPPINYNWLNALPNKLFEFIQARLCVVVSPNPDMKRIVESNKVGIVTDNYSAKNVAENILKLTNSDILMHKQNSHKAAEFLNAEHAQKIMLMEAQRLLDE